MQECIALQPVNALDAQCCDFSRILPSPSPCERGTNWNGPYNSLWRVYVHLQAIVKIFRRLRYNNALCRDPVLAQHPASTSLTKTDLQSSTTQHIHIYGNMHSNWRRQRCSVSRLFPYRPAIGIIINESKYEVHIYRLTLSFTWILMPLYRMCS